MMCLECFERSIRERIAVVEPLQKEYPVSDLAQEHRSLKSVLGHIQQYRIREEHRIVASGI